MHWQGREVAGHMASAVREQRVERWCSSDFLHFGFLGRGVEPLVCRVDLLPQLHVSLQSHCPE